MKTLILTCLLAFSLGACGRPELSYPCNFHYAPASDNGSKCDQCFATAAAELSFMEKYALFHSHGNTAKNLAVTAAVFGPNPGTDLYPLFMDLFISSPSYPKGWCGQ